jgi:predicted alpha/beta-fold hydrolase
MRRIDQALNPRYPLSPFKPAWWCRQAHLQTLWPYLFRRRPRVALRRERLELPDGDFLDLDWSINDSQGPIVLVLHGLEGSSESKYALGTLNAAAARGWRAAVLNFRGCSGEPNRLARSYHSGETGDIAYVVELLKKREPHTALAVVGYSLGGNALLKWLGEARERAPIEAAAAVSPPFLLAECAWRMERGFSRLYQSRLVRLLKGSVSRKRRQLELPLTAVELARLRTFREFDDCVTAPLHGFAGVDDYYARSSSRQYLRHIAVPTLILHSRDDPFMTEAAVPTEAELSPAVEFDLQARGGHVGFVAGRWPWRAHYWLEQRIPAFLSRYLPATD